MIQSKKTTKTKTKSDKDLKSKTVSKKTTAKKTDRETARPKIRIQKISSLSGLPTNRDSVVDLKKDYRPSVTASLSANYNASAARSAAIRSSLGTPDAKPRTDNKNFYSDEEDDSLAMPSEDLSLPPLDDDDDEDLVEPGLKLKTLDGKMPTAEPTRDYAAMDKQKDNSGAMLENLYGNQNIRPTGAKTPVAGASRQVNAAEPRVASKLYRRLAITFVMIVLALVVSVAYFTTVKTTINVSFKNEPISDQLTVGLVNVKDGGIVPDGAVAGLVKEAVVEQSKLVAVPGTEIIGEEVAGKITLTNDNNKAQPLVANTRLLSASGKLYRLRSSVNVPAGGKLEAEVYADQSNKDNVVGAEKFTIPGLWEGLQDKIYAESKAGDITYGQQTKKVVTQEFIDKAIADFKVEAFDKVKADVDNAYNDYNRRLVKLIETSVTSTTDAKVGEERDNITVTVKETVQVAAFNDAGFKVLAESKIKASLPATKQFTKLNDDSLTYNLVSIDMTSGRAEIAMTFAGEAAVLSGKDVIDRSKLINLDDDQLRLYLAGLPDVKDFQVEYFPSFIKKAPSLVDKIEVNVVE